MAAITFTPEVAADRDVVVTVELTFKETQLRGWAKQCGLASNLADAFEEAIASGNGFNAYGALSALDS